MRDGQGYRKKQLGLRKGGSFSEPVVVDLAKGPSVLGSLARSTTSTADFYLDVALADPTIVRLASRGKLLCRHLVGALQSAGKLSFCMLTADDTTAIIEEIQIENSGVSRDCRRDF